MQIGSRLPALISATGRCFAHLETISKAELENRFKAFRWDDFRSMESTGHGCYEQAVPGRLADPPGFSGTRIEFGLADSMYWLWTIRWHNGFTRFLWRVRGDRGHMRCVWIHGYRR